MIYRIFTQYWNFSSSTEWLNWEGTIWASFRDDSCHRHQRSRSVAKYGKCGSTLAYLSDLGNKNLAKVLTVATHLGLFASNSARYVQLWFNFQHCWCGNHVTNTTDMDFSRDEHNWYGFLMWWTRLIRENIKRVPLRARPYVCIRGQSSIYNNNNIIGYILWYFFLFFADIIIAVILVVVIAAVAISFFFIILLYYKANSKIFSIIIIS